MTNGEYQLSIPRDRLPQHLADASFLVDPVDQEFRGSSAGWFWLGASHAVALKMPARAAAAGLTGWRTRLRVAHSRGCRREASVLHREGFSGKCHNVAAGAPSPSNSKQRARRVPTFKSMDDTIPYMLSWSSLSHLKICLKSHT